MRLICILLVAFNAPTLLAQSVKLPLIGEVLGKSRKEMKIRTLDEVKHGLVEVPWKQGISPRKTIKPNFYALRFGRGQAAEFFTRDNRVNRVTVHFSKMSPTSAKSLMKNFKLESATGSLTRDFLKGQIQVGAVRPTVLLMRKDPSKASPAQLSFFLNSCEWHILNNKTEESIKAAMRDERPMAGMSKAEFIATFQDDYNIKVTMSRESIEIISIYTPMRVVMARRYPERIKYQASLENGLVTNISQF